MLIKATLPIQALQPIGRFEQPVPQAVEAELATGSDGSAQRSARTELGAASAGLSDGWNDPRYRLRSQGQRARAVASNELLSAMITHMSGVGEGHLKGRNVDVFV